tara:strand:- start:595 stop:792 length:198 start_codon:yes stop_codon:yes gene_type:complete
MTRKHFNKLADLINTHSRAVDVRYKPLFVIDKHAFVVELMNFLKEENSNFDKRRFAEACGLVFGK